MRPRSLSHGNIGWSLEQVVGRDLHFPQGESGPNRRCGLGRGSRDRFVGSEGPISDAIILLDRHRGRLHRRRLPVGAWRSCDAVRAGSRAWRAWLSGLSRGTRDARYGGRLAARDSVLETATLQASRPSSRRRAASSLSGNKVSRSWRPLPWRTRMNFLFESMSSSRRRTSSDTRRPAP